MRFKEFTESGYHYELGAKKKKENRLSFDFS